MIKILMEGKIRTWTVQVELKKLKQISDYQTLDSIIRLYTQILVRFSSCVLSSPGQGKSGGQSALDL